METRSSKFGLCGPQNSKSIFSHASGHILLFVSMYDACALRATCRKAHAAIAEFPFDEGGYWSESDQEWVEGTPIPSREALAKWRICFPRARGVNVSYLSITDDDVALHLQGMRSLEISGCLKLTSACFDSFKGIKRLVMNDCTQFGDEAFTNLRGIDFLAMVNCNQTSLTSAAFAHLQGIHTLVMLGCNQSTIDDRAFAYLSQKGRPPHTLHIGMCDQPTLTDASLRSIAGVKRLLMFGCPQFTDCAFADLKAGGLETLDISGCLQISNACFPYLDQLSTLIMNDLTSVDERCLEFLKGVGFIDMGGCRKTVLRSAKKMGLKLGKYR